MRLTPDRAAIVCGPSRLTYTELHDVAAGRSPAGLRASGIGPGDRVVLSCPNVPDFPIVYFGILKAGATVVPLNVLLKPLEIAFHLRDADAAAYFCFEGTPELPMAAMGKAAFDEVGRARFHRHAAGSARRRGIDGATTLAPFMRCRRRRSAEPRARRHRRDPLHVGHDRAAEGRRADAPEHRAQRARAPATCSRAVPHGLDEPVVSLSRCRCSTRSASLRR